MYAATDSSEGDCYLCVPPDLGIDAAALGASESAAPGTSEYAAPGARESALTVSLADPSGGPVLAHSSTVLPCPAAPSGLLSGLHLPSFSTTLECGADLQDARVDQFTPGVQRVTHYTCSWMGRHLATFTRRPGSSLYTLTTTSPPVTACGQVAASGQVFSAASKSSLASAPCSCCPLSHETLLWHHRLGHPSLPCLRGMASRTLVSGLPRFLPPLPTRPAPTCVPCVEGQQRAAPHSSEFPPTEAPLQTLHMDVWGPARVRGQGHERYFLLVVDDYSRYTSVFPLRRKGEVIEGPAPSGVSHVDPVEPVEVAVDSGAARGAEPAGAGPGGAEPGVAKSERVEPGGAEHERVEPGGAELAGAEPERAESGGPLGVPPRREPLSPQQLHEWYAWRCCHAAGGASRAGGAGGAVGAAAAGGASGAAGGAAGAGAARATGGTGTVGDPAGVGATGGAGAVCPGGAQTGGTGAAGAGGAAGFGAVGAGAVPTKVVAGDPGPEGIGAVSADSGGSARPRPHYVPLLQQILGLLPSPGPPPPLQSPPPSRPESLVRAVCTGRRLMRQRPPPLPSTHSMTLRPSTAPQHVPLPSPLASSLPALTDPESDFLRTARPTVTCLLTTVVTDPSFESTASSTLIAELVDFASHCRLDYAASLVAQSASVCPLSVRDECSLGTDVLEDRQEEFDCFAAAVPDLVSILLVLEGDPDAPDIPTPRYYAEAITGPYSSQWLAAMDAEMAS
ncbi:unnamed protein product [Closterium sp. NIES-54]